MKNKSWLPLIDVEMDTDGFESFLQALFLDTEHCLKLKLSVRKPGSLCTLGSLLL